MLKRVRACTSLPCALPRPALLASFIASAGPPFCHSRCRGNLYFLIHLISIALVFVIPFMVDMVLSDLKFVTAAVSLYVASTPGCSVCVCARPMAPSLSSCLVAPHARHIQGCPKERAVKSGTRV